MSKLFSTKILAPLVLSTSSALMGFSVLATAFLTSAMPANAASLTNYSLNTNNQPDAPTSWYNVGFTVNPLDAGKRTVTFSIANLIASGNNTKISNIYFGTDGGTPTNENDGFFKYFLKNTGTIIGSGTNYQFNWNPTGANQIDNKAGWGVEVLADPKTGSNPSVVNAGETLNVTFTLKDANTTEQQLINAFLTKPQELGIAFHVQSITGGYSEWYQAKPEPNVSNPPRRVPEPTTTTALSLFALGTLRLLKKRGM